MNKKRKRSLKASVIYFLVLVTLSLAAYGYKTLETFFQESMSSFELDDIVIEGNNILSRRDVLRLCGLKENEKKLLEISPRKIVVKLLKSPYIKSASAVRSLPSTLHIEIIERNMVAFIYGKGLNLIDDEGILLPVPKSNRRWNLPFIVHSGRAIGQLGKQASLTEIQRAVQVLNYINILKSSLTDLIAEISIVKNSDVRLRLVKGGSEVRIKYSNYQKDLFLLSEYLQVYQDWNELADIEYIDMRFNNQFIIKEKKG